MSEEYTARPYRLHRTDSGEDVSAFMAWLQEVGAEAADPVGVSVGEADGAALAGGEDMWLISLGEAGHFARAALAAALMGGSPPRLVATDAEEMLVRLSHFLGGIYDNKGLFERLSQCTVGDLRGCAATVGHPPAAKGLSMPDAAYTARLLEPQYQWESPPYYRAITLPLVRLRAEWRAWGQTDAAADWWVSYPDLWLRVLTHYTADPTLGYVLDEGQEPLPAIARLFEWSPGETAAVLVWHICGRSVDVMSTQYPKMVAALPDDLPAVAGLWDRRLPNLWNGITGLMNGYTQNRLARTLYGRKLRSGAEHPGTASAHIIFGTVQDILEVAAVTFWQRRPGPSVMIKGISSLAPTPLCRVVGVGPQADEEKEQWIQTLMHLAPLAAPLGTISLAPTAVRPPEESNAVPANEGSTSASSGPTATTPTTPTPTKNQAGNISGGRLPKAKKRSPTKPKTSVAAPKRSRATGPAAEKSCESSPRKSRAKSSKKPATSS